MFPRGSVHLRQLTNTTNHKITMRSGPHCQRGLSRVEVLSQPEASENWTQSTDLTQISVKGRGFTAYSLVLSRILPSTIGISTVHININYM